MQDLLDTELEAMCQEAYDQGEYDAWLMGININIYNPAIEKFLYDAYNKGFYENIRKANIFRQDI